MTRTSDHPAVKQADLRAVIDEFENILKIAGDNLRHELNGVAAGLDILDYEDPEGDGGTVVVDRNAREGLERRRNDAGDDVAEAFTEFDWSVDRALRALRKALGL